MNRAFENDFTATKALIILNLNSFSQPSESFKRIILPNAKILIFTFLLLFCRLHVKGEIPFIGDVENALDYW